MPWTTESPSRPSSGPDGPPELPPPSRRSILRIVAVVAVLAAAVWFGAAGLRGVLPGQGSGGAPAGTPGATGAPPAGCTEQADVGSVPSAKSGDVVCLTGTSKKPLTITTGGTAGSPIVYSGDGSTTVRGIQVKASNVVVQGFVSTDADSVGAQLQGDGIVFQNNTIKDPKNTGDDTDGIRFFGDDIKLLHNTISGISDGSDCTNDGCGDGPHPDCMQTWYSDTYPTSSTIVIDGNRCEKAAAQCLMAEGPVLPGEDVNGPGESANWTYTNNYCESGANQALMIKDIKNLTVTGNDFEGTNHKAIALADGSTGAHVGDNKVNPRIGKLITFDDNAEADGYVGPKPDEVSTDAPGGDADSVSDTGSGNHGSGGN